MGKTYQTPNSRPSDPCVVLFSNILWQPSPAGWLSFGAHKCVDLPCCSYLEVFEEVWGELQFHTVSTMAECTLWLCWCPGRVCVSCHLTKKSPRQHTQTRFLLIHTLPDTSACKSPFFLSRVCLGVGQLLSLFVWMLDGRPGVTGAHQCRDKSGTCQLAAVSLKISLVRGEDD